MAKKNRHKIVKDDKFQIIANYVLQIANFPSFPSFPNGI